MGPGGDSWDSNPNPDQTTTRERNNNKATFREVIAKRFAFRVHRHHIQRIAGKRRAGSTIRAQPRYICTCAMKTCIFIKGSGNIPSRALSLNVSRTTRPWPLTRTPYHCERSASVSQLSFLPGFLRHFSPRVERNRATSASRSVDTIAKGTCGKFN